MQRRLDRNSLHLRVYADESFANNSDSTTQLGYLALLCGANDNANLLQCSSHKSRRTVWKGLGGDFMALADGLGYSLGIREDLERIIGYKLKLTVFTDFKYLFHLITGNPNTSEKRLIIDIHAIRKAYTRMELDAVAWTRSESNLADAFTKPKYKAILN